MLYRLIIFHLIISVLTCEVLSKIISCIWIVPILESYIHITYERVSDRLS